MKRVYKYPFTIQAGFHVNLPFGFKIVHIGLDASNMPCIWAEIDPGNISQTKTFHVFGTGHDIPEIMQHVGSFVDDPFVWHVYMVNHDN